ncbi:YceI-like domain-containing protein [Pontibacter mucosus]|uniref:YceI-like domain-containing protein n=1 Tax=Pontibacter mucosus TaxID=1649266 RepID=A0A2T5Y502_9BACT|nr:YceI family protein [Pontibacter mucosus]PTX11336.1 YceI-like domain-containing protein [Pontibacter mucosus]
MKPLLLLLFLLLGTQTQALAQARYATKTGHIWFFSDAPLEDIEAHNRKVVSILDTNSGELVFSVPMNEFQFRKKLMQTHFNENYVESDKYPKASFKGKVINIKDVNLQQNAAYKVRVQGVLNIHGRNKDIDTVGVLEVKDGRLYGKSTFSVTPQEFDIRIPRLVRNNIARRIDIYVDITYEPLKGNSL